VLHDGVAIVVPSIEAIGEVRFGMHVAESPREGRAPMASATVPVLCPTPWRRRSSDPADASTA
jgi:hypothetical protein